MAKVSIIIPVYNMENYIKQAVESVMNQTLKDIEIICIDDCSTDNSLNILKELSATDNRIILLEQETNQGQGIARNRALDIARGEYIMCLDSDDWLNPNACELVYKQISKNKNDFVLFNYKIYYVDKGTTKKADHYIAPFKNVLRKPHAHVNDVNSNFLLRIGVSCNKIYSKEFLDKYNIRYATTKMSEDAIFSLKCLIHCDTFSVLNKCIYNRRIHKGNTTKRKDYKYAALDTEMRLYEEIKRNNIDEKFFNFYLEKFMYKLVFRSEKNLKGKESEQAKKDYYDKIRTMAIFLMQNEDLTPVQNSQYYKPYLRFINETFEEYVKNSSIKKTVPKKMKNRICLLIAILLILLVVIIHVLLGLI